MNSRSAAQHPPILWQVKAVIVTSAALLCIGLFNLAWIDDILNLIMNSRAGYDGWRSITIYPQCGGPGFGAPIPITLLPGMAWAWLLHTFIDNLYTLRLMAIATYLVWIAYTVWFLKTCIFRAQPYITILAGILGFAGLGTLPFAMLIGRPETPMILAVTFFVSLPFLVRRYPAPAPWVVAAVTLVFLLTLSWFLSVHAKALFYAPLLLLSAGYICKWHKYLGILLVFAAAFACQQAWHYHLARVACPDSPVIGEIWSHVAILPTSSFQNVTLGIHQFLSNILNNYSYWNAAFPNIGWWRHAFTHADSLSSFALDIVLSITCLQSLLWMVAAILIVLVTVRTFAWIAVGAMAATRNALTGGASKYADLCIPACLLAACVAQCALQSEKKFYNFSLIWMTLVLCLMTLAAYLSKHTDYLTLRETKIKRDYKALLTVTVISQSALLLAYLASLLYATEVPAINGEVAGKEASISPQHYAKTSEHVLAAAQMCHMKPDSSSRHVVIDQYTYLPLKETYQPFFLSFWLHEFDDAQKLFAFMRARNSSGLVTLCTTLPPRIRALAHENQGVCCLPPP